MSPTSRRAVAGSFRDPAGHIFERDGRLFRLVSAAGEAAYQQLIRSGLYERLASAGRLIPHAELGLVDEPGAVGRLLEPVRLPMISYPYEWAFSALKDAALLTLAIEREARRHGMILKDASAYNVQFDGSRPVFIDTLSFEPATHGPWKAYRQFCQHFLAPLALMAYRDVRLGKLPCLNPDGVPVDLASRLLPLGTWTRPGLLMHVHLHARMAARNSPAPDGTGYARTRTDPSVIVDSLERTVAGLEWTPRSDWLQYAAEQTSYSDAALAAKATTVTAWIDRVVPGTVWDLGANTGRFSRIALRRGAFTVALDGDASCVEQLYCEARREGHGALLPLLCDLSAPSPAIGWANEERATLFDRGHADLVLALALIHHLALGHGIPLAKIASFFARIGPMLIVEFVPADDPMAAQLLAAREIQPAQYSAEVFDAAFGRHFVVEERVALPESGRVLNLMRRR
ncbi:MAG: SAM-dependent methyltransferase [Acidobacteriota bacterium]